MNRFFRNTIFYLLILLVTVGIINFIATSGQEASEIKYSEFIQQLHANQIESMTIQPERGVWFIEGKYHEGVADNNRDTFFTYGPPDETVASITEAHQNYDYLPAKSAIFHTSGLHSG